MTSISIANEFFSKVALKSHIQKSNILHFLACCNDHSCHGCFYPIYQPTDEWSTYYITIYRSTQLQTLQKMTEPRSCVLQ